MIAILFLLFIFLHGIALDRWLLPKLERTLQLLAGFLLGSLLSVSFIYWVACLVRSLDLSLVIFFFFSIQLVMICNKVYKGVFSFLLSFSKKEMFFILGIFFFSFYLFSKTFGYDSTHGNFLIASNVYLDFGAHIPFIRSFSLGNNFPGEVPFFQNTGLLYYFLFDFYAGTIEHLGIRIDIAYNFLSAVSFTTLLFFIYHLASKIFLKKSVGVLSVLLFLFPSSFSFLTFFQRYGLNAHIFFNWWHNNFYLEGLPTPLNKTIAVAQFWNLDPYMNQRHLIFAAAFFLLFVYICLLELHKVQNKKMLSIVLGISLGLLTMWHTMIYLAICMIVPMLFLLYPKIRKDLIIIFLIGLTLALPQLILIKLHSASSILFTPGFLLEHHITLTNEFIFWLINLGIGLFLIPIGVLLSNSDQRKFFLIFLPLFLIPNLVHLSSRFTFDDHKYFNVWIIMAGMFSALVVIKLISKNILAKIIAIFLGITLILSGLISIMVIKNDVLTAIPDYPRNRFLQKIITLIPPTAITLTNGEIYDPLTIVGKKTLVGRVQYIFVYGGDASERLAIQENILRPQSQEDMIRKVHQSHIQYVVLYKNNFAKNEKIYNTKFYTVFKKLYEDNNGIIYKT